MGLIIGIEIKSVTSYYNAGMVVNCTGNYQNPSLSRFVKQFGLGAPKLFIFNDPEAD